MEDWEVTLADTGLNTMTGGRLKRIQDYIDGDHFMLTYGDGVADVDIPALVDFHMQRGKIGTVTGVRPPGRFGEIEVEGDCVANFNEKPPVSYGLINGGFFVFQRSFVENMPERDDLILERDPLFGLAQQRELAAYVHNGFWHCMDSSRDYQLLNGYWNSGNAPWAPWAHAPNKDSIRLAA